MIKFLASLAFLLILIPGWSLEQTDSTKSKLEASASLSLNSNGIAYIPAFSLDKPALTGAFSLRKGRFSYDPQLSYGLNLKPWIIDNWFHYRIMDRPAFELKAGAVISGFFSEYETEDETLLRVQKYLAAQLVTTYRFTPASSMAFTYLIDRGQDPGTLSVQSSRSWTRAPSSVSWFNSPSLARMPASQY